MDAGEDVSVTESSGEVTQSLSEESVKATQTANNSLSVQDGITTIQQLLLITTGQFHFESGSIPLSPGGGSYSFHYDLDFSARTAGGGSSFIGGSGNSNIDGGGVWSFSLPSVDFSDGSGGQAQYTYSGLTDASCSTGSCTASVTVTAFNSGGVVAANGTVSSTFTGGSTTVTGSGSGTREPGLSV